mmetsp:Transcript_15217/g.44158  ORF Transcript_15217/g.44158 Transcript_15217/m.44158 type:complete len:272 (+) Transcript_15217:271-1086(+)
MRSSSDLAYPHIVHTFRLQQLLGRLGVFPQRQSPVHADNELQRLRRKVIGPSELVKPANVMVGLPILHDEDGGHDHNAQFLHEEGRPPAPAVLPAPLDVDLDEPRLEVPRRQFLHVTVKHVAHARRRTVEVHHHPLALLRRVEEFPRDVPPVLTLPQGRVGPVPEVPPLGLLLGPPLHLGQAARAESLQIGVARLEEGVVLGQLVVDGRLLGLRLAEDGRGDGLPEDLILAAVPEIHCCDCFRVAQMSLYGGMFRESSAEAVDPLLSWIYY